MRNSSIACLVLLLGCSKSSDQPSGPLTNKSVAFFGDSITVGFGASATTNRWTSIFSVVMHCNEENYGILGEVLQNGENCSGHPIFDQTTIPTKTNSYGALFIALGMNDVGINNGTMSPSTFQATLSNSVDYAVNTKGWKYGQIVIVTPAFANDYTYFGSCNTAWDDSRLQAYVTAALLVATTKGCIAADVYTAMNKNANLLSTDGIHPNDSGYQVIANYLSGLKFSTP
jgi:lysophospholipase L1-like esterase